MFKRLILTIRNWLAGGDISRWHYNDMSGDMQRLVDGKWETRAPTEEETYEALSARAW